MARERDERLSFLYSDAFSEITKKACEVKTSSVPFGYKEPTLRLWARNVGRQLLDQKRQLEYCFGPTYQHCVIVNQPWMEVALRPYLPPGTTIETKLFCGGPLDIDLSEPLPGPVN